MLGGLIPLKRWKKRFRNIKQGDIVLLIYLKFKVNDYQVARVVRSHKDAKGLVHSVDITFRPRDRREPLLSYKSKALSEMKVGIQRLVVIQTAEESTE